MRLLPGTRVGPYEVVALLGAGGMAEVYRAKDTRLGRDVAIKVISEALSADRALLERFEREAKLAAALSHPNVVALHDVGFHDGKPYFVTELLQGASLRRLLAERPIPLGIALDWAAQMARGLAAAHEQGIVHRDLKPENVFVTRDGQVKLLDFGIAKLIQAAQGATPHGLMDETVSPSGEHTRTGVVLGTPGYMSPEQVRGDPVDARSDFFTFGAVLYEMLSGQRAFPAGAAVESGYAILHNEPEPLPPAVPSQASLVIHRCLAKEPARRFQTARDLAFNVDLLRAPTGSASAIVSIASAKRLNWRRWLWPLSSSLAAVGPRSHLFRRTRSPRCTVLGGTGDATARYRVGRPFRARRAGGLQRGLGRGAGGDFLKKSRKPGQSVPGSTRSASVERLSTGRAGRLASDRLVLAVGFRRNAGAGAGCRWPAPRSHQRHCLCRLVPDGRVGRRPLR